MAVSYADNSGTPQWTNNATATTMAAPEACNLTLRRAGFFGQGENGPTTSAFGRGPHGAREPLGCIFQILRLIVVMASVLRDRMQLGVIYRRVSRELGVKKGLLGEKFALVSVSAIIPARGSGECTR